MILLAVHEVNGNGLDPRQEKALASLLEGKTIALAAKRAGVTRQTVYAWLRLPEFVSELRAGEGQLIDGAVRRLVNLQDQALDTVAAILSDPYATNATRLRAAGMVLDSLLRLRELRNLEERIQTLEAALHG